MREMCIYQEGKVIGSYRIKKCTVYKSMESNRKKMASTSDGPALTCKYRNSSNRYGYLGLNNGFSEQYMVGHWWAEQD